MGFRNPVTTATDPTARQAALDAQTAASNAQTDAARALTQIIPGTRLAADAIDGKTITGVTVSGATVIGSLIRAIGTGDAYATSSGHALQAGPTNGENTAIDGNEILARNNGVLSPLFLTNPRTTAESEDLTTAPLSAYVTKRYTDGKVGQIRSGNVNITPSAANTPTSVAVSFGTTFPSIPNVQVSPSTTVPGKEVTGVGVSGITTTGCTLWVTRINTTVTGVYWLAATN